VQETLDFFSWFKPQRSTTVQRGIQSIRVWEVSDRRVEKAWKRVRPPVRAAAGVPGAPLGPPAAAAAAASAASAASAAAASAASAASAAGAAAGAAEAPVPPIASAVRLQWKTCM
jgi:hypothetical protein